MTEIVQNTLPYDIAKPRPLPGIAPLDSADWLIVDEAYAGQMAERERLLKGRRDAVIAMESGAAPAVAELLDRVLGFLRGQTGFCIAADHVIRPDGARVAIDRDDPLGTLGMLVQEDLCVMEKRGDEHVLTAALLCFPSNWTLREKFLRPLIGIHVPVDAYDDNIAKRVQRLFDGIGVDRPLWRFNLLWYDNNTLHNPRSETCAHHTVDRDAATHLRSERQVLMRLPETQAVVFSIHTYMIPGEIARSWL
ncbi:heme-dependent oxidative N-demethylase family protein [Thalassovita aquimarina]|uniref:DUF3445 domain-containing protein n=1 Tax=Thalassovita aquimarina TaxID=2785917 RepID=A0ABS5HSL8_9RHOB|nr:DUF3445 domain-containing protein [Thalassovita aquimarina]MBR9651757.1 DUF3445 domain-containing protein [Thalassovita aquimarina]